jgi:hypothetical protein
MHFMKEVNEDSQQKGDEFWVSAAPDLLTALFLAAGSTDRTLLDVYEWLNDPGNPKPYEVLHDEVGDLASAASLNARQTSAPETREGIYEFARTACRCLRNPDILRWVVPPGRHQSLLGDRSHLAREFTVEGFALSHQTIYLLSKDGAAAAAPLVASLTDRILVEATREAERQQRGRLDPPMVVILDEAANICKIADLPLLYSHLGGRGIYVLTILQSRPQARSVWGHDGFDTMWSAATIKLIGAGIDDPDLAADISSLVGEHDISIRSISSGTGGTFSESVALRKDPIMSPSAIRAMAKGTAILLATGAVPASIELQPWYRSDRADEIELEVRQATAALTGLAVQAMEKEEAMAAPRVARLRRRRRRADVAVVPAAHRPPPPAAAAFGEVPWGTDATHSATTTAERPVTTDEPPATSISVRAYSQDGEDQGVRDVDFDDTQVVPLTERTSKQRKKMRP